MREGRQGKPDKAVNHEIPDIKGTAVLTSQGYRKERSRFRQTSFTWAWMGVSSGDNGNGQFQKTEL